MVTMVAAAIVLAAVGAGGAGLWHVSSSPMLCNSCHIMKPYVAAWKVSTHNQVACVQCHYPPGLRDTLWVKYQAVTQVVKWATHTYSSKPFAEVEDGSCLRSGCHDRSRLERPVVYERGIVFDHALHLNGPGRGPKLRCTSCHSQVVVGVHIQVVTSTCFLCHFKGVKTGREIHPVAGCPGCHQAPKSDIQVGSVRFNHRNLVQRGVTCDKCHLNVVEGNGEAPRERCLTCHNQPDTLQRYPDTALVHDVHVKGHNIECGRCHTPIKHHLPAPIGAPTASVESAAPVAMTPR